MGERGLEEGEIEKGNKNGKQKREQNEEEEKKFRTEKI
jgi:hypothetical protein